MTFEPETENYRLLRCNVLLNGAEDRAVVRQAAISNCDGSVELEIADVNLGDHRVRVGAGTNGMHHERESELPCRYLPGGLIER